MSEAPARNSKPPSNRDDALAVLRRLREHGHVAYFAGGCVRDMLLGLTPSDFDVATNAPPQRVRELFNHTQAVGAKFGVILVKHRQSTVEVATFRSEGGYTDGRRPDAVRFTTAEEDAQRRDFTINGMFFDPLAEEVVDFVGGQKDLVARTLRAIGDPDARLEEDHLRLLRAVRFAARFNLNIEPATAAAIRKHSAQIVAISPERIAEEFRLMLTVPTRTAAWDLLVRFHLVAPIFRFIDVRDELHPDHGTSAIFHQTAADGRTIPFSLALAAGSLAYLHPRMGTTDVRELCTRATIGRIAKGIRKSLRISNEENEGFDGILGGVGILFQNPFPTIAMLKRFLARPTSALSRDLLDALMAAGMHGDRIRTIRQTLTDLEKTDIAPPAFISGDDLTAMGLSPGPMFKRILDQVYDAQLEDRVQSKDQAMELARQLSRASTHPSTR